MPDNHDDVDPKLVAAIDVYVAKLRLRMLERVRKGEKEHRGQWLKMSIGRLLDEREEETDDYHVYSAMLRYRTSMPIDGTMSSPVGVEASALFDRLPS